MKLYVNCWVASVVVVYTLTVLVLYIIEPSAVSLQFERGIGHFISAVIWSFSATFSLYNWWVSLIIAWIVYANIVEDGE